MNVSEVVDGVHLLDFGLVNAYLCVERDRLTLIDSGIAGRSQDILDALAAIGAREEHLRQIICTHHHPDHVGGAARLARLSGARVLVHRSDAPVARGDSPAPAPDLTDEERALFERITPNVPDAPPVTVHRELEQGDEIDLFGGAEVISAPGHTAGSIAIRVPAKRTLFTGDAVAGLNGEPVVGYFNVDRGRAAASFAMLAEFDFDVACFGHGAPLTVGARAAFGLRLAGAGGAP